MVGYIIVSVIQYMMTVRFPYTVVLHHLYDLYKGSPTMDRSGQQSGASTITSLKATKRKRITADQ